MKLGDVKVIVLSPDLPKYDDRRKVVMKLLSDMNFQNVIHYITETGSTAKCLSVALINILRLHSEEPILVVEDDINLNPEFGLSNAMEYEIDVECDAIYLGNSMCKTMDNVNCHVQPITGPDVEAYSDRYVRVLNMLSGHAVLYISSKYKAVLARRLYEQMHVPCDVTISRIQRQFLILAHRVPLFYQCSKLNNGNLEIERVTKFRISL